MAVVAAGKKVQSTRAVSKGVLPCRRYRESEREREGDKQRRRRRRQHTADLRASFTKPSRPQICRQRVVVVGGSGSPGYEIRVLVRASSLNSLTRSLSLPLFTHSRTRHILAYTICASLAFDGCAAEGSDYSSTSHSFDVLGTEPSGRSNM